MTAHSAHRPAFSRALDPLERACLFGAGLALTAIALTQAWQVFGRYVLNASPGWTEPVALVLMGLVVMLGSAIAVRRETHFRFSMLAEALPVSARRALIAVTRLIAAASGLMMLIFGSRLMLDDWGVAMAGAGIPLGLRFLPLALGGALILIFSLERLAGGGPKPEEGAH